LAQLFGDAAPGTVVPLTQQDLADLTGAARPTVNQSLKVLESRGAIELFRGGVRLLDVEVLRRRAGE
jgi:DNA-binding GntR family transcriptional regulator